MTRLNRWLLAPAPAHRLAVLRWLIMGYATAFLVARVASFWSATNRPAWQWRPVGVLSPVAGAPSPGLVQAVFLVTVAMGVAATVGWRYRFSGPAFALGFWVVTTHRLSWGSVLHTEHLVLVHVLVLAVAPAAIVWSLDARRRAASTPSPDPRFGWPIRAMAVATVVGYVVAGVAKLRYGGGDWLVGDVLRNQVAFDNLRKILLGDHHSPVGGWAVRVDGLFPPIALVTVVVELAAPLALLGGRLRTVWVAAAWGFHVGIVALMAIVFPYPLSGIAFAPLFAVEGLAGRWPLTRRPRPWPLVAPPALLRAASSVPRSPRPADAPPPSPA